MTPVFYAGGLCANHHEVEAELLFHPPRDTFVALRSRVRDVRGNRAEHTVIRSYRIARGR